MLLLVHFIELVNAAHTPVRHDQGPGLQGVVPSARLPRQGHSQPCAGGSVAANINSCKEFRKLLP